MVKGQPVMEPHGFSSAHMQRLKFDDILRESMKEEHDRKPKRSALPFGAATLNYGVWDAHQTMGTLNRPAISIERTPGAPRAEGRSFRDTGPLTRTMRAHRRDIAQKAAAPLPHLELSARKPPPKEAGWRTQTAMPPLHPLLAAKTNRVSRACVPGPASELTSPLSPRSSAWRPFGRCRDWRLAGDGFAQHSHSGGGVPSGGKVSIVHYGVNGALPVSESAARYFAH